MSQWSIEFSPLVPLSVIWVALGVLGVLIALLVLQRSRGTLLRMLALGAVILALANPALRQEERESLGNIAIVVIDKSTSQALADRPEQADKIKKELEKKLGAIKGLDVVWVNGGLPNRGVRGGTALFGDLNSALANVPPDRLAGVIMVTDGQVHDVPKSAAALGFDAPVHVLLTGRPGEFDRRIEVIKAPKFGIVGQRRVIEFAVRATGPRARRQGSVSVRIRREGQPDQVVRTFVDQPNKIAMAFPHAGLNIVEIELQAAKGELTKANNRVVVAAKGVRENLRVLLVSGEPHAGERTWRNLLKSDAAVDLVHFTILRPPDKLDDTPIHQLSLIAFPTRELFSEKIRDFDLIIFDRYKQRGILQLLYYDKIARYVSEHGGGLLIAAGDDYAGPRSLVRTPVLPVLPALPSGRVMTEAFKANLTRDGQKHPVTRDLPGAKLTGSKWGRWFRQVEVTPERGRTVMVGAQKKPLLILDRKGKGRVALLTSDHAWLWARGFDGGGPHTDLLRRLSHWLMKEPDLEEERLLAFSKGLKVTIERRSMELRVAPITISKPGGGGARITLNKVGEGLWRGVLDVKEPGLYKMQTPSTVGVLTAVAHAGIEDPIEMSEVTATDKKLRKLVEATGAGILWTRSRRLLPTASDDVTLPRITLLSAAKVLSGSGWIGLRDRNAQVTRGVQLTRVFAGALALAALLMLLTLAWWREGR